MTFNNFLQGERVRLAALRPEDIPIITRWQQDGGYLRLYDAAPANPKTERELTAAYEALQKSNTGYAFGIRLLGNDALIGNLELDDILWSQGVAWLSIGIGEPAYQGQGYGLELMRLALHFAFGEINLRRVQLTVFAYNERAIRLYERLGFQQEGVFREFLIRDGKVYDMLLYGILRREWESGLEQP